MQDNPDKKNTAYMREALRLARRALGTTSPNPAVGAVVVKRGHIIGRGYTMPAGGPHAEVVALQQASSKAANADLYVTLEPCNHFSRTPPCTDQIIDAGIKRIFAAWQDPNPLVKGKGFSRLRRAGIQVEVGLLESEAAELNEAYHKFITTGEPFVTLKLACSLDGKIATAGGDSRWITGVAARRFVHKLRALNDAILVGTQTILADDPELTVRLTKGKNPRRIILDRRGRVPISAKVFANDNPPPIVAVDNSLPQSKIARFKNIGTEVLPLPSYKNRLDLAALLTTMGEREITSIFVEGGGTLAADLLERKLVDKVYFIIAPIIIGGENSPSAVRGKGAESISDAFRLQHTKFRRLGEDIALSGYLPYSPLAG